MRALPRATTSERTSGVAASSGSKERLRDQCDASPAGRRWSAWAFLKGRGAAVSWLGSIFIKLLCSESTIDTAVPNLSTFMKIESNQLTAAPRHSRPVTAQTLLNHHARPRSFATELAATPEVRADMVARGKALVADSNYPSKAHIKVVARVLAGRLSA